ncbi:MAG: imidazole glycerol phosphate synthase subunit HisH [Comamonadaceae bacterium]|nr:MAG: imidazole glycerol phosphate synthase subunit HisH [Comamonadaceae bacterium]
MTQPKTVAVTVIDYGIGNLLNVVRALEHCGASVTVVDQASQVTALPDRLVLPGVGAFADGMKELKARGFDDLVKRFAATERPFLGVCVGAQMLFDVGEEFGEHEGLGLIAGRVQPVPAAGVDGVPHRIPHIGWSPLEVPTARAGWAGTILADVEPGEPMYFVHSFAPVPASEEHRLADTWYDGVRICAAVARGSVYGCQFHPERSASHGLSILSAFLKL